MDQTNVEEEKGGNHHKLQSLFIAQSLSAQSQSVMAIILEEQSQSNTPPPLSNPTPHQLHRPSPDLFPYLLLLLLLN